MIDFKKRFNRPWSAGWPGSVGDGRIWRCNTLNKVHNAWLSQLPMMSLPTGNYPKRDEVNEDIPRFIYIYIVAYPNTCHMVSTYRTIELLSSPVIRELNKSLAVHGITLKMLLGSWSFYIPSEIPLSLARSICHIVFRPKDENLFFITVQNVRNQFWPDNPMGRSGLGQRFVNGLTTEVWSIWNMVVDWIHGNILDMDEPNKC